ncbi:hypothetical protein [Haloplanus natans]|uniref:hypothetical protein n=1 Tax=Haloplanus natans TaxID=376171 RepID=UPI0006779E9F|nr:hypothetical protein [Haloplanus natans]
MSAETRQQRLDGGLADRRRGTPPKNARRGYAEVWWYAPPDTDPRRVATWCQRAAAEGVIR